MVNSNYQGNVGLIPQHKNEKFLFIKKIYIYIKESKNTSHRLGDNVDNHITDIILESIIYK